MQDGRSDLHAACLLLIAAPSASPRPQPKKEGGLGHCRRLKSSCCRQTDRQADKQAKSNGVRVSLRSRRCGDVVRVSGWSCVATSK